MTLMVTGMLTGCTSPSEASPTPTPTDAIIAGPGGSSGGGTTAEDADAPGGAGDAEHGNGPDAISCPIGAWVLDNASWERSLGELWRATVPDSSVQVTGELRLDWDEDGSYTLTAFESEYLASGTSDGIAFTQAVRHDGTESGAWTELGSRSYELVTTDETEWRSSVRMTAGGTSYEVDQRKLPAAPWSGTLKIDCSPGAMTTTVSDEHGTVSVDFLVRD